MSGLETALIRDGPDTTNASLEIVSVLKNVWLRDGLFSTGSLIRDGPDPTNFSLESVSVLKNVWLRDGPYTTKCLIRDGPCVKECLA
jgi:hypothetical protein